jgi:predicted anti-sigma-YlaC factor YlaD
VAFALKSTLIGTTHIRREQMKLRRPLLSAVVTAILTALCIAGGEPKLAFPLAVGAWFATPTYTVVVVEPVTPWLSVTVSVTTKVPTAPNVCDGDGPDSVEPSPKSHA